MFSRFKRKRLFLFLSIIGPGIITSNVDNDAGGITTYSVAGAHFGYSMLWTIVLTTIILIVVQEMAARMGAITGQGLAEKIREKYGVRPTFYLVLALFITDMGNTISEFAGWAAAMEIFGVSKYISVPAGALLVWWLVVKGTYRFVEKVFLFACTVYLTYIISGILAKPEWSEVIRSTVTPSISFDYKFLIMLMGIIGTTIAPWQQFYLQSAFVEKGIKKEHYKMAKIDVITGGLMVNIVAFFIIVSCGATLFKTGIRIENARDAAIALTPLAGKFSSTLFAIGLANASLFSACILPIATAFYICEGLGWEAGVNKTFKEAPHFYTIFTILIVTGAAAILIPKAPLVPIMLISQVINGIMLPFLLIYVLLLINRKDVMGKYVNGKFFNLFAWTVVALLVIMSGVMFYGMIFK